MKEKKNPRVCTKPSAAAVRLTPKFHSDLFLRILFRKYSHLFNKRGGWNKRGGSAKVAKSINVEVGITVEVGFFLKNP